MHSLTVGDLPLTARRILHDARGNYHVAADWCNRFFLTIALENTSCGLRAHSDLHGPRRDVARLLNCPAQQRQG